MSRPDNWESEDRQPLICPFLGLVDDSATAHSYPSTHNSCYHPKAPKTIRLAHQRAYCLTADHTSCEEYLKELDESSRSSTKEKGDKLANVKAIKPVVWISLIAAMAVAIITWQVINRGLFIPGNPGEAPASSPPVVSEMNSSPTLTPVPNTPSPTLTSIPVFTDTPLVSVPSITPTSASFHGLETPIGTDQNIIIHQVQSGESLVSIASHFWTTTDAISAINFQLQLPLQVNRMIVVPYNQTDVQGWPVFETFKATEDIDVEMLAQQLSADPALLKLYNGFTDGEIVRSGDWVLVPHVGTSTP